MSTGCFLVGVTGKGFSKTTEALMASVSDNPYDIRTFLRSVNPEGTFSHIGTELISTTSRSLTERGYFARPGETTRGVNAKGLAFTCAMVFENKAAVQEYGIPYADITQQMMQRAQTVEEAIDLFQAAGRVNPAYSVILADAQGNLAHLEVGNFGIHVNDYYSLKKPGIVFAVNCYLSQSLSPYNAPLAVLENTKNNNQMRLQRGQQLAKQWQGSLDIHSLAVLLSDHAHKEHLPLENVLLEAWGYSICNHGTRGQNTYATENLPWGTVSAEILQPREKTFWYAYGWPCGQKPQYKDQMFQKNSWGEFIAFPLSPPHPGKETALLTSPEGEILVTLDAQVPKIQTTLKL